MTDQELYWLSGWLEGEGSFYFSPRRRAIVIQAFSVDRDVIEKAVRVAAARIYYIKPRLHVQGGWDSQEGWRMDIQMEPAAELMRLLLPLMGSRRSQQIEKALVGWENRTTKPVHKVCSCGCGRAIFGPPKLIYAGGNACAQRAYRLRQTLRALLVAA